MSISSLTGPEPTADKEQETKEVPLADAASAESKHSEEPSPAQTVPSPTQLEPVASTDDSTQPSPETPKARDAVLEAMLSRIAPVSTVKKHLKLMIYSNYGVGKTSFLGGVPNNLILDTEKGLVTLEPDKIAEGVSMIPFKTFQGTELMIDKLAENPKELERFTTFSVDTISELHKRGLGETLDTKFDLNPNVSRYKAETEDHTENNEHIRRLTASLRDQDRNVILTAHARTVESKTEDTKIFPDFSEKLANTLGAMMDIVGYLYVTRLDDGELHRVLMVRTNGNVACKSRIHGGMPDQIIDPTWDKIWGYFLKHNEAEEAAK